MVRNTVRPAARVSSGAIAMVFGRRLSKTLSSVRPCTDTFGRKSLGFLIVEHFQYAKKPELIGDCPASRGESTDSSYNLDWTLGEE